MPCESCATQFSMFRRKRACVECDRFYCGTCLRRGGGTMCSACRVLSTRPLTRHSLSHLKVRDLQYFLHRQNISTRGCVEKEDLVNLVVTHVNSGAARRRPQPARGSTDFSRTFSSSIKGFTNNINSFINSAFDIRNQHERASPHNANCCNTSHAHVHSAATASGTSRQTSNTYPHSNESTTHFVPQDAERPIPPPRVPEVNISSPEDESRHDDTADCLEVEDLDDSNEWEIINRPAEPLPNDSDILIAENSNNTPDSSSLNMRAASELDLRRSESADTTTDTSSLKDDPYTLCDAAMPKRIRLDDLKNMSDLEELSAKQLKELLALNRVDFKGCVERTELLERAKRLWKETTKSRVELNKLSIEDSCKICMDAPLECVLLECGHMAACTECSKRLSECPICRQYVVRAVRVFRS